MPDLIEITISAPITGSVGNCPVCNHTNPPQCPACKPLLSTNCIACKIRFPDGIPASVPPPGPPGGMPPP